MRAKGFRAGIPSVAGVSTGSPIRRSSPRGGTGASARSITCVALVCACALLGLIVLAAGSAQAAVTHEYLSGVSAKLNQGVPAVGPHGETIPLPGPFIETKSLTVGSGELYVGEGNETSRIDKFDDSSGAFLGQLPQLALPKYLHQGMAVGHSTGEAQLYVAGDVYPEGSPLGGVAVLNPAGGLLATWTGADTPAGSFACFECAGPASVAVDDSSNLNDSAAADVYVVDRENKVVDVFKPEAGGGEKYVTQLVGPEPPSLLFSEPVYVAVDQSNGTVLVTDSENNIDIFKPAAIVGQYEFDGKLVGPGPGGTFGSITGLAVDGGNGDIYVSEGNKPAYVDQFNAEDEYEGRLTGPPAEQFNSISAVAVDPSSHRVYVADYLEHERESAVDVFGPDIVIPDVLTEGPSSIEPSGAVLQGKINPRKAGSASCEFAWGTSHAFGHIAACEPEEVAEGSSPVSVHATLSGLQSDTTYYYRLQASNKNGTNPGDPSQDQEFTTPGPGLAASASDVASTSATLDATVNPHNHPTSYYFQYGKSAAYESEIPLAPGADLGSGEGGLEVSRHVQGLSAGTVYHYRVVAVSEVEAGNPGTFAGADQTFTTHTIGVGLALPDARQWELVSPRDKHGAQIGAISESSMIQSSQLGDVLTYPTFLPPEANPLGYFQEAQIVSTRGAGGWSSQDISLPHRSATNPTLAHGAEYRFFSEDLSMGLVEPVGEFTSLAPYVSPPDTESAPDIRHNSTCTASPTTCFEPLLTAAPGYADVPPGTEFGGGTEGGGGVVNFVGANPDLSQVVLSSSVALTPVAVGGGAGLYEWSAGKPPSEELQLVSILPEGEGGTAVSGQLGYLNTDARGAVSSSGSRVIWSTQEGLYLRDTVKGKTIRLDAVQGGSGKGQPGPHFQMTNGDASIVFFTEARRLTSDSGAVGGTGRAPDLYECEIVELGGEQECKLSDLTPLRSGQNAKVQEGVLGTSEDGSYIYFVATGVLTEAENGRHEKALQGADNLYVLHHNPETGIWEAPQLVTALANEDSKDWASDPQGQTARVSPDGRYVAFMSSRSLTGYDNRDANSGHADEEVYLFDAHSGRLVCASCDPTGARPVGLEYQTLAAGTGSPAGDRVWEPHVWLAANIPGWTPAGDRTSRHQSRYLSNEGRLFFNSSDALVSQDINNTEDVYEFEPVGIGTCASASATFSPEPGGCTALISSGTAPAESAFLDASESGGDVFFLSVERLAPQDVDTALDVYDAHICTGESPCASVPVPSPPCVTADACRAAPLPQPAAFGAPASSTFSGAGNVTPKAQGPPAKPKALTRAQKLARALSACHKKANRGKRAACERQARKRYRAARSHKSNATKRGKG